MANWRSKNEWQVWRLVTDDGIFFVILPLGCVGGREIALSFVWKDLPGLG